MELLTNISQKVSLAIRKSFTSDYCEDDTILDLSVTYEDTNFKKFYNNQYIKISSLGESKNGNKKYLVRLKETFKLTYENEHNVKSIQFGEGIIFPDSTVISCYRVYTITIKCKTDRKQLKNYINTNDSGIYLFEMESKKGTILKIGLSTNIFSRYSGSLTTNPDLIFIGYIKADPKHLSRLEKDLHDKFIKYHYKREWFYYNKEITDYFLNNPDFVKY